MKPILDEYKCPVCGEKLFDSENKAPTALDALEAKLQRVAEIYGEEVEEVEAVVFPSQRLAEIPDNMQNTILPWDRARRILRKTPIDEIDSFYAWTSKGVYFIIWFDVGYEIRFAPRNPLDWTMDTYHIFYHLV